MAEDSSKSLELLKSSCHQALDEIRKKDLKPELKDSTLKLFEQVSELYIKVKAEELNLKSESERTDFNKKLEEQLKIEAASIPCIILDIIEHNIILMPALWRGLVQAVVTLLKNILGCPP